MNFNIEVSEYSWCYDEIDNLKIDIKYIAEVGSRDGLDAIKLAHKFNPEETYIFEADPQLATLVESNLKKYEESLNIKFFNFALGSEDKNISFYAVDRYKYDNQGIGSFYKVNFDNRLRKDPDYKRGTVQKEINISQKKYESLQLTPPDLLAMDVQGAELEVLKGFEDQLKKIKIIILETSISDNYIGGASFIDVHKYLRKNFKLIKNSRYPTKKSRIFQDHIKYKLSKNKIFQNDFDLLYVNKSID